jgi:uncharacterized protein YecT (DUF1311 family)
MSSVKKIHILHYVLFSDGTYLQQRFIHLNNSISSMENGKDNVPIEDNCLEEERSDDSNYCLMHTTCFFARLNIYYKAFISRISNAISVILHIMLP